MMTRLTILKSGSAILVSAFLATALEACQEGSPSGYQIPLPTEQTPRVCPGEVRSVAANYPAVVATGATPLVAIQIVEGRNPESVLITWSVQASVTPATATDVLVRDSRDTTKVLFAAQRLIQPGPTFLFAGSVTSLSGSVDADTFYETVRSGAAEIVFVIPGSANTQGRIGLTTGVTKDWTNRTC